MIDNCKKVGETNLSEIYWQDENNGIVLAVLKPKANANIDLLKEDFNFYKNNVSHPKRKIIIDVSEVLSIGKEARDYIAGSEGIYNYFDAVAILSNSKFSIGSIIANVAIKVYAIRKPTKVFHNKKEALKWLRSIR